MEMGMEMGMKMGLETGMEMGMGNGNRKVPPVPGDDSIISWATNHPPPL